jgi:hypothetical protein
MTTHWRVRVHRAAALSLVLAVAPLAAATSASASAATTAPQSAIAPAVPGFGHWHRESVLDPISPRFVSLSAVSCAGRAHAHCVAVGSRQDPRGNDSSYSEIGNGTAWHVVYTAHPRGVGGLEPTAQTGYRLHDVSCTGPNRCIAVGDFFRSPGHEQPLAEDWNGHSWTVVPTPAPRDSAKLDHISCATANACMAIGTTTPGDAATAAHLVERWNGSSWSISLPPLPATGTVTIDSVGCPTTASCTVVGSTTSNGSVAPFADSLSDGTWRTDALPATTGNLSAVDCTSPTACVMIATIGAHTDSASSYSLSGHADSWTKASLPDGQTITSIACTSMTSCVVAGFTTTDTVDDATATAMAHWDGTSWTPINVLGRDAFDISCTSGAFCVIVGFNIHRDGFLTYVHHAIVGSGFSNAPFPTASVRGSLDSVSCPTSAVCMAVREDGVIEREHGRVWSISRPAHSLQRLESVSCVTATWCMSVGTETFNERHQRGLTALWNGRGWRTLPPAAEPGEVDLDGVSCTSRTFCLAVEDHGRWAQRWNGHSWLAAQRPHNKGRTVLTSVSCTSKHFCAVVGYKQNYRVQSATVTQIRRGAHWRPESVVRMTVRNAFDPQLASVSCVSDRFCLAVGSFSQGPDFAKRWNGREWKSIHPPVGLFSSGVSCASHTRCMALTAGSGSDADIEASSWNRTSWTPRPVDGPADLESVSCVALTCTAVGDNIAARIS